MSDKAKVQKVQTRLTGKLAIEFNKYREQQEMGEAEAARDLIRKQLFANGNKPTSITGKVETR